MSVCFAFFFFFFKEKSVEILYNCVPLTLGKTKTFTVMVKCPQPFGKIVHTVVWKVVYIGYALDLQCTVCNK